MIVNTVADFQRRREAAEARAVANCREERGGRVRASLCPPLQTTRARLPVLSSLRELFPNAARVPTIREAFTVPA